MKNNDLSSDIVPHLALVFEGALGFIDEKLDATFQKYMDRGRYEDAIALWTINDSMATQIWKLTWHMSYKLDIITFLGPKEFAKALEDWLGEQELPISNVYATTPELLGRQLNHRPDIIRVYDPFPDHALLYGQRGRVITNVNQLGY